jgi:hypothetical protein
MGQPLDKKAAVFFGEFVEAAYQMYASDKTNLTPAPVGIPDGWNLVAWIQMSDFAFGNVEPKFYGFIAQNVPNPDSFVVAIRGTEGAIEWWDNLHIASVPFDKVPNAGRVAQGFDQIYDTLQVVARTAAPHAAAATEPALKPLEGTFAEQVAQAVRANVPPRQAGLEAMDVTMPVVAVAGHSLGAALCTLYVVENAVKKIISNPTVCTFASPRVGNAGFVGTYGALNLTSWRIVNAPDLVPNLPPDIFAYRHVNTLSLFDSTGKVKSTVACAHALDTYLSLLDNTRRPGGDCIAQQQDHEMADHLLAASTVPEDSIQVQAAEVPIIRKYVYVPTPAGGVTVNVNVHLGDRSP